MNKFRYVDLRGETPPPTTVTGWAYSDAVIQRACPKCGCGVGFHCESAKGNKLWPPHQDRIVIGPEHACIVSTEPPSME